MESLDASWSGCLLRSASDAPYRSARPSRRVLNACANKTKVAIRHCCSRLARGEAVQMLVMTHGRAGYGTDSHGKHEESRDMIPNGCLVLICWATTLLGTMTRAGVESTIVSAPRSELRAVDRVPQLLRTLPQAIVIGAAVSPGHHVVYPLSPCVVDGFRSEFRQTKRSCFHRSGSLVITSSPPRNVLFLSRRSYHVEGKRESTQHRVPLVPSRPEGFN